MRSASRVPHLLGLIAMLLGALALPAATAAQTPTCADYSSAAAAQFALDINPNLAASLDPDGNGIACDHEGSAAQTPSSTELQLPSSTETPAAGATQQPQATADVIDGQPAGATTTAPTTTTQPQAGTLDGRLGGTRASFEAAHGQPVQETPSQNNPNIVGVGYTATDQLADLFVVYASDQAVIIWLTPTQPWTTDQASAALGSYVPADVTTLPQPETLADGTLLMPVNSPTLAAALTQDVLTAAGLPGVPGDMYLLLTTDGGQQITEVEIGAGNGDNVRQSASGQGGQTTTLPTPPATTTTQPTTPPATTTTTTTDSATFLQQARTEVNQYRAEITELRTILGKDTNAITDADTSRLTEIVVGWMAIDTTPITAPPEQAAIAQQLTTIHADLSTVGSIVFTVLSTGDTSQVQEAADTLNRVEANLDTLDQQLTALGV